MASSSRNVSRTAFIVALVWALAPAGAAAEGPRERAGVATLALAPAADAADWRALPALYAGREVTLVDPPGAGASVGLAGASGARRSEPGAVKPKKALLLSLLLPGAGELYSGARGRATAFFIAEGAIWAHFTGWEIAGHLRKNNYIEQAQLNAGVGTDSGNDEYWRLVGAYESSSGSGDSYEEALRREARDQFPSDPAAQDAYVAERLPVGSRGWLWTSDALRASYRSTREESSRAYDRAQLSIAFAILNRIASAIDTQILHSRDKRGADSADGDAGIHVLAEMTSNGGGRVAVRSRF